MGAADRRWPKLPSADHAAAIRGGLSRWAGTRTSSYPLAHDRRGAAERLRAVFEGLSWADARAVYDQPDKPSATDAGSGGSPVMSALWPLMENARRDVLIEAAYFIATDEGVAALTGLAKRGVRVRILTNSLATNDLVPAHAGYSRYRERLVGASNSTSSAPTPPVRGKAGRPPRANPRRACTARPWWWTITWYSSVPSTPPPVRWT